MLVDIFCEVIDNFGDIGVAWRLSKCLSHDQHWQVRLWVDDLEAFQVLEPSIQPVLARQKHQNIDIIQWNTTTPTLSPAPIVIETFSTHLHPQYLAAMPGTTKLWINLDYLSAESWVEEFHGLPSLQHNGLKKYFFYPGFTAKTGGLLREQSVITERQNFTQETQWLQNTISPNVRPDSLKVSLFCYPHAPVEALLASLMTHTKVVDLFLPQALFPDIEANYIAQTERIQFFRYPFLRQSDYDYLLWSCDWNIVRGEDSFVRAQWAGKPMLWHIYPQTEETHLKKLRAWLELYEHGSSDLHTAHLAWNNANTSCCPEFKKIYLQVLSSTQKYTQLAQNWQEKLFFQDDLATQLADFCSDKLK